MTPVSTTTARGVATVPQAPNAAAHAGARARAREGTDPLAVAQASADPPALPAATPAVKPAPARAAKPKRTRPARPPLGLMARRGLSRWWAWTGRPLSLRALWRTSAVNRTRIPLGSTPFGLVWKLSNATDRLLFFVLVLLAPTALTGPLRWLAARPTRRWAFYLLAAVMVGQLYLR